MIGTGISIDEYVRALRLLGRCTVHLRDLESPLAKKLLADIDAFIDGKPEEKQAEQEQK